MTVIVEVDARPCVGEPGADAARVAEIEVIAADALVDDQHDVARGLQLSRDQANVLALSRFACDRFVDIEAGITERGEGPRQAPRALDRKSTRLNSSH